jgi:hypothetical protein
VKKKEVIVDRGRESNPANQALRARITDDSYRPLNPQFWAWHRTTASTTSPPCHINLPPRDYLVPYRERLGPIRSLSQ